MEKTGIIILVHGSRGKRAVTELPASLERITGRLKNYLRPGVEIAGASLQFNRPSLEEAVAYLCAKDVRQIIIMPYFLFSGRHITEDIPEILDGLRGRYPGMEFVVTRPLGEDEAFTGLVARRIEEAAPQLVGDEPAPPVGPGDIERQSMEIVSRLVPWLGGMPEVEQAVIKRIIHASGDPEIAPLVKFSPAAAAGAFIAIGSGCCIYTDVRMVAAGINRKAAGIFGCSVKCAIDELEEQEPAGEGTITRAAAAMHRLGKRLESAIVAIGNAPTALLALLEMIDSDGIRPALVVGMPVGFVQAKESKDALMKRDIPYITVAGTRGGSAMAAATVNALLKIAAANRK